VNDSQDIDHPIRGDVNDKGMPRLANPVERIRYAATTMGNAIETDLESRKLLPVYERLVRILGDIRDRRDKKNRISIPCLVPKPLSGPEQISSMCASAF
jgi:hypothetical protein